MIPYSRPNLSDFSTLHSAHTYSLYIEVPPPFLVSSEGEVLHPHLGDEKVEQKSGYYNRRQPLPPPPSPQHMVEELEGRVA